MKGPMIRKVLAIKNIGRFHDFTAAGDVEFRKTTLIFAENGHGKTTLAAVLRSLQHQDGALVAERRTLNAAGPPEVRILHETGTAVYAGGAWGGPRPEVEVFDESFVTRNVYAGDVVGHEQKKNLYRVIVGEKGVELANAVDVTDGRIRDATRAIAEKKQSVAAHAQGMAEDAFLSLPLEPDLEDRLAAAEAALVALNHAGEIRSRALLRPLALPELPAHFHQTLGHTLAELSESAAERVRAHLQARLAGRGEAWVAQGLGHADGQTCPFCGQGVDGTDLIDAYRQFFHAGYEAARNEAGRLAGDVNRCLGEAAVLRVQHPAAEDAGAARFWQQFVPFDAPVFPAEAIRDGCEALRAAAEELAERKAATPLDAVIPGPGFEQASALHEAARQALAAYNAAVVAVNARLAEKKAAAEAGDPATAAGELERLRAVQRRHGTAAGGCAEYREAMDGKKALEGEKKAAKKALDSYTADIFGRYQAELNALLGKFNAGFHIDQTKGSYLGGTPSSSYAVVVNNTPVDVGSAKPGAPTFKTALSSGDRSALALAFFLVRLQHDDDLPRKVVVFDDPITSQDMFRATCTRLEIARVASRARQVIVLSHSQPFLKHLWDNTHGREIKALCIRRAGGGSCIAEWDIEVETQGEYFRNHRTLVDYLATGTGDLRHVARCIRLLLEEYLRLKAPLEFRRAEWLGDFLGKIRNAAPGSPLVSAAAILPELDDINAYAKRYHHRENPGADTEPITDTELSAFVRRTLDVIARF